MILVTGGTGLTGSHLLLYLSRKGERVKAIYRTKQSLNKTKSLFKYYSVEPDKLWQQIDWVQADITEITSLEPVFDGVTQVYHTAAKVSFKPRDKEILMQTNVEGTANLLHLSIENKIQKFLHVSSIASLGTYENPITEKTHWNWKEKHSDYAVSKYLSEMEVWRAGQEGLQVVIINPSVILGAHFRDNGIGKIITKVNNGMRFYPPGGNGFVDVWDVVRIMTALMNKNVANQSFIISGYDKTYKELLSAMAISSGKESPKHKLPRFMAEIVYWTGKIFGKAFSKSMLNTLFQHPHYSSQKIIDELDYVFIPFQASIQNLIEQYQKVYRK